ncbi:Putative ABC transporter [Acididesulfobacillus acetoxydans]|uniref:ABC transporter n=1 Tax=Acididesulfobacillus acetoxydans TaxID=1561005 RepID=A0A8S0W657_9FIRM|nr:ABC transporter ATP-binding protein [Acididesulfobacillus acetoxydans]CAA7599509.1 Putative ABC transporter [Acididesulfobacillus acetoxydans]CEJ08678.1 Macrolide export ATP-binding/permease protein MacB [Acididesulfobacillus acetoxydans]
MIDLREIKKVYATGDIRVTALGGVDLHVDEGEFVSIMGPSGSGKSTMMNILGCLDTPSTGEYILDGTDVSKASGNQLAVIRNRKIGFVFQGFNLLPRTTAIENVELPLLYAGVGARERKERALQALAAVGLGQRVHHKPKELSGGQQQRVAIARALVTRPAIILADEPTGNLDSKSSEEVMAIFQKLHSEGNTILIVTHEPDIAEYTRRIVRFRDGHIEGDEAVANPRLANPRSEADEAAEKKEVAS